MRRRLMMQRNILPDQYQQVEYLASTGKQCIYTGVYHNNSTGFSVTFNANRSTLSSVEGVVGANFNSENRLSCNPQNNYINAGFANRNNEIFTDVVLTAKNNVKVNYFNERTIYLNDVLKHTIIDNITGTSPYPLLLFALYWNLNVARYFFTGYLYECIITQGEEIIRDFIPCYIKSTGKPGMYDIVNGRFYTNHGTGEFIVGPDVR